MATPKPKANLADTAGNVSEFLANPAVAYGLGALAIIIALWLLVKMLPGLFGGLEKGGKAAFDTVERTFNATVDRMQTAYSDIVVRPSSQNLDQRTRTDQVKGVGVDGDRALSDLVDSPYEYFKGLIMGPRN